MDMLDIIALTGLEWLYDTVENRYGRVAAWLITSALALAILAVAVAVLITLIRK